MNEEEKQAAKLSWNICLIQNWRDSVQLFITDDYDFSSLAS